jgi:hypothetical protein
VSVVVNGVSATVANRSFAAHGVLLVPGQNTITAVATDRAGNTDTNQVQVTLQQVAGQTLSIVSGNDQSGVINTLLPQPLVVMAANALGQPMPNVALNFSVLKSDGFMISGQQQGRQLTIQTGANGQASVQLQLGRRNGAGINQVSVSAPGFVGQAVFSEDSTVGATAVIHTVSGEWQMGAAGVALAQPLVAIVFDAGGNPVVNVPVTFTVQSGGGLIGGGTTFVTNSDSDGKAYAVLVLGQQEGINNNTVTASFPGMTGEPASFISSGVVPGPAANTIVSGLVLDDTDTPIPNATASIQGTNLSALTNAQGQFTIANAPVGDIVLYINGATSTSPYTFPTLSFQMATIPGVNNTLGHPVYLPALDTSNSQVVGGDQPVQLTMTGVPGLVYTVAPNSVTFPDGSHVGTLTLSQVHGDRVPMAPPNGTAPRLVGTLQPAGVLFNPPIQMQLPNTDGLAPGQVEEIFSFHHDLEQFVVEGTARVSQDGSVVVTDPGFGLTVSGWHGGGGNNQNPTCGDGCGACQACSNGSCAADPTQNGQTCTTPDGCTVGTCSSGSCNGNPTSVSNFTVAALDPSGNQQTSLSEIVAQSTTMVTVSFVSQITSNCTNGVQYTWDFGDGNAGSGSSLPPSHMYMAGQTYNATFSATCNGCPNSPAMNATVSVTIAQIQLNYVQFEGNKRSIMKDGQTLTSSCQQVTGGRQILPVVTPEWQAACGATNGTPGTGAPVQEYVAYTQGNNVTVKVDFVVTPSLSTPIPNVYLQGQASYAQIAFMQSGLSISGTDFSVDNLTATSALPGEVDYESAFTITWSISTDGQNYTTVGMSQNPLYVLLNDAGSNSDANLLTAIYLAASEGSATDADTAVTNTWSLFSTGSGPVGVTTWDNVPLAYYPAGQPFSSCATTAQQLVAGPMTGVGQCNSFATLLMAALAANGISYSHIKVTPTFAPASMGPLFLVKQWNFGSPSLSPPSAPYQNFDYALYLRNESSGATGTCGPIPGQPYGMVPPCPNNKWGDLSRGSGLAGQNSTLPSESAFSSHFILEYTDGGGTQSYYDPSYGVIYYDTNDFEDTAVAGYGIIGTDITGRNFLYAVEPEPGLNQILFTTLSW